MFNSFYAKLSALFLLLILGLGVFLAILGVNSAQRYADEVEQKLNRTLAEEMVPRFEPLLRDSIDHAAIEAKIQDMTGINRRIEIYLLGPDGSVKASFAPPTHELKTTTISMGPIEDFMHGEDLPILGDDPRNERQQSPFSVAHIEIMGQEKCYIYVLLDSERAASVASMVGDSYILRTTLVGLGLIVFVTAVLGLVLFRRLTKRLNNMQEVVSSFESGNFDPRMPVTSDDEIGQLAECFNRMADTLVESLEELRQADKMRRELVANVSHDLRSPLASIQGYLETVHIKGEALDPDERQRYVETALHNAQRLNTLVSELFELSKLESNQIEPSVEPFPVAELVQDIVMQYQPQAESQGVHLEASPPSRHVRGCADIGLLERVLSNLIDNAIHYTPEGGEVHVNLSLRDDAMRIAVADNGPGIPEDDLPHIFDRFYRVEKSRDRNRGGAGLGLAIAHKIVDLHGRTLHVESTVGDGTTFYFELPLAEDPQMASDGASPEASRKASRETRPV